MKVRWEVDDGYVGKDRPQYTEIDDEELKDYPEGEERDNFIEENVRDDFEQRITFSIMGYE